MIASICLLFKEPSEVKQEAEEGTDKPEGETQAEAAEKPEGDAPAPAEGAEEPQAEQSQKVQVSYIYQLLCIYQSNYNRLSAFTLRTNERCKLAAFRDK